MVCLQRCGRQSPAPAWGHSFPPRAGRPQPCLPVAGALVVRDQHPRAAFRARGSERSQRRHGTERPGSCALLQEHRAGKFTCTACGQPLFVADRKFESGTGWPSFFAPMEHAVATSTDRTFSMTRTEAHCSNCGGHLGHVFPDGPPPTGQRYCMNGVALEFEADP